MEIKNASITTSVYDEIWSRLKEREGCGACMSEAQETRFANWKDERELTHWKRPSCWERLKAGGEGDNRG